MLDTLTHAMGSTHIEWLAQAIVSMIIRLSAVILVAGRTHAYVIHASDLQRRELYGSRGGGKGDTSLLLWDGG